MTLEQLLTLREWAEFFQSLSDAIKFELRVYSEDLKPVFNTGESQYCVMLRQSGVSSLDCSGSCCIENYLPMTPNEPVTFKCRAGLMNFIVMVSRYGEKMYIAGKGEFATYDDLSELQRRLKAHDLPNIPLSNSLYFPGEDYLKTVAAHVHLTVNRMIGSYYEKYRSEDRLQRLLALFDSKVFNALSKHPELMYRYILDTIEYVFGGMAASLMMRTAGSPSFTTVSSTARYRDIVQSHSLTMDDLPVLEMLSTGEAVFVQDPDSLVSTELSEDIKSTYYFPIFSRSSLGGVLVVVNKIFSNDEMKIMNAFRSFVQVNMENLILRKGAVASDGTSKKFSSIIEFANSIASILDKEELFNTVLDKSIEMLEAEQGSLMLLDEETAEFVIEARKCTSVIAPPVMRISSTEGIAGQVLNSNTALLVEDIENDPRFQQENRPRFRTKSFVSVPITVGDRVAGVLNISDKAGGGVFGREDVDLIEAFVSNVGIAIERSLLHKQAETLMQLSITDPLTNIYNRRYLNRRLAEEITRHERHKTPFSFMMLDLDKFKEYNDTHGHIEGDNLIKDLAMMLSDSLRNMDIAARFGGDEFVVVFPQTPKIDAIMITNRLKEKIDSMLRKYDDGVILSVSIGLATYPDDASSIMDLIEKTDQAMYLAKKGGGNRIIYL
ncbi:MAG: sensor domain-containing diguanylate cyclase [Nitrospira sp.]|nr:sensor domain-containing diguanylate cyclase [bacterium]MBL7049055.1 sensor domain-containing diguanylate cyclase [Nitrospira sp.]